MKKILVTAVAVLLSLGISAQADSCKKTNRLSVTFDFLTHGEVCKGGLPMNAYDDNEKPSDQSSFVQGRTRLIMDYEHSYMKAKAVIKNSAVWGSKGNQDLGLSEGWVKLTAPNGLFIQMGRIALSYDDERIIGPDDWVMETQSHDALLLGYEGRGHKIHGLLAYNQNSENTYVTTYYEDGAQDYKTMQLLWYHYDIPKGTLGASFLFMNIGMQAGKKDDNPHTEYQQLMGCYVNFHPRNLTFEGSYYRQSGKNEYMCKIDAWMASLKATFNPSERYGFEAGFDYLSGDDFVPVVYPGQQGMPHHYLNKGFTPVYGSHHQFYGLMDFFYESAYSMGFTPGLQNAYAGFYYTPNNKLNCGVKYHYLAVATNLEGLNRTLGHDIELEGSYQFTKDISLSAGYTFMVGTKTMDRLKHEEGDKYLRWGWISLLISPKLFTSKW